MISSNDLKANLIGMALGVRFSQNFAIADNLGKITDFLLYSNKESLINSDFFSLVESDTNHRYLKDVDNTRYLAITTSDIILEVNNLSKNKTSQSKVEDSFESMVLNGVFSLYDVREIRRVGYLSKYVLNIKSLTDAFLKKAGQDTNNISLRFQKNYPLPDSLVKKEVNDYCSNIYTINKKPDSEQLYVRSDFQVHFDPPLDDKDEIRFKKFIHEKDTFNDTKLLDWLNSYLSTQN